MIKFLNVSDKALLGISFFNKRASHVEQRIFILWFHIEKISDPLGKPLGIVFAAQNTPFANPKPI